MRKSSVVKNNEGNFIIVWCFELVFSKKNQYLCQSIINWISFVTGNMRHISSVITRKADRADLPGLQGFLTQSVIDQSFSKPLSDRTMSISDRVEHYFENGYWLISIIDNEIQACVALLIKNQKGELSTLAMYNTLLGKKAALQIWPFFIKHFVKPMHVKSVTLDSWDGNRTIERILFSKGFDKGQPFYDLEKRLPGHKSVIYTKTFSKVTFSTGYNLHEEFKEAFTHTSVSRDRACSVLFQLHAEHHGHWGEGCPREYVTGETVESSTEFISDWITSRNKFDSLKSLCDWVKDKSEMINHNPSAWCAIELAWLSLLAYRFDQPIESYLGFQRLSNLPINITAPLGINSDEIRFRKQLTDFESMGAKNFKIKASGDFDKDKATLDIVVNEIPHITDLRLDFNNCLNGFSAAEVAEYIESLQVPLVAIEEPVGSGDISKLNNLARKINIPIILDETFCRPLDLEGIEQPEKFLPNLRISKLGGIIRTLEAVTALSNRFPHFVLGCHVGETGILGRYWMTVLSAFRDKIKYQEGLYTHHLMRRDAAQPSCTVGKNQEVEAIDLVSDLPGQGIDVLIDRVSVSAIHVKPRYKLH